ncbi:hypothetical protein ABPG72_007708 [Tetrahymena utriculariae]
MGKSKLYQLSIIKEKLYRIDSELGGTAKQQKDMKGSQGEFENLFNDVKDRIFKIKSSQKFMLERAQKHGQDRKYIDKELECKNEVTYCEGLIEEMAKLVRKQKSNKNISQVDKERREKSFSVIKNELYKIMESLGINPPEEPKEVEVHVQTLKEFKVNVLGDGSKKNQEYHKGAEANEREMQALDDAAKRNERQDDILKDIDEGLDVFKGKAILMGEKQDEVKDKIQEITKIVDNANKVVDTSNQRLKDLLTKYRQPSKFCLDMTLLVFLLGLIAIGYTSLKGQ